MMATRDECQNDLHKHEFPSSANYIQAADLADSRFDAGWDNRECPDCGTWGWEPPAAGAGTCVMCGTEIHFSEHWSRWQHNYESAIYCPGKTASVATPDTDANV